MTPPKSHNFSIAGFKYIEMVKNMDKELKINTTRHEGTDRSRHNNSGKF
jgi:hypothetical protein